VENKGTLLQSMQDSKSWMNNLVPESCTLDEISLLKNCQDPIIICSDGELKNNKGSYGIVIQRSEKIIFEGYSIIPNTYNMLSLY
jgi:hypothetical protein